MSEKKTNMNGGRASSHNGLGVIRGWYVDFSAPVATIEARIRNDGETEKWDERTRPGGTGVDSSRDYLPVSAQLQVYRLDPNLEPTLNVLQQRGGECAVLAEALRVESALRRGSYELALFILSGLTEEIGPVGGWARLKEVEILERLGKLERAWEKLQNIQPDISDEPPTMRAQVSAKLHFRGGSLEKAVFALEQVYQHLKQAPVSLAGTYYRSRAIYLGIMGDNALSIFNHRRALDCFRSIDDRYMLAKEYTSLGQTYMDTGELDHAEFFFNKGREETSGLDNPPLQALLTSRAGMLCLIRGDLESAAELFGKDLRICRGAKLEHGTGFAARNLGKVKVRLGETNDGIRLLKNSVRNFESVDDQFNAELSRLEQAMAVVLAHGIKGGPEAEKLSTQASLFFEQIGRAELSAHAGVTRALVAVNEEKWELAREEMESVARSFKKRKRPDRLVEYFILCSETCTVQGRKDQAVDFLKAAYDHAAHASHPWLTSDILKRLGSLRETALIEVSGFEAPSKPILVSSRRGDLEKSDTFEKYLIKSNSDVFKKTLNEAGRIARYDETVVLEGETGVGKEMLARYIHSQSDRASSGFVALNCGAIAENLLEDTFFGHTKGAFTGAIKDGIGIFEAGEGGTVFLDEVGELSPKGQVALLRFLEERKVRPIGSVRSKPLDIRVIAATNRDLAGEVRKSRFREDLYYRIAVCVIRIPPLRERKEDLPLLVDFILSHIPHAQKNNIRTVSNSVLQRMNKHDWPGNLRELNNILRSAAIQCTGGIIDESSLPPVLAPHSAPYPPDTTAGFPTLEEATNSHILSALKIARGNKSLAADLLGIHRNTLAAKLKAIDYKESS